MQLPRRFLLFLFLSVFAAYAPSAIWIPLLPPGVSHCNFDFAVLLPVFLVSPVAFISINLSFRAIVAVGVLAVFLAVLVILSAGLSRIRSRRASGIAVGCVLIVIFLYSLTQGLMFLSLVRGLNAI
jgi:hypothetical protein